MLRYAPAVRLPAFAHEAFNFCLVLSGGCVERRDGSTYRYVGPALTVNPPTTRQEFVIGEEGVACLSVDVEEQWVRGMEDGGRGGHGPASLRAVTEPVVNLRDPARVASALRLAALPAADDDLARLHLEEGLIELIAGLSLLEHHPPGEPPAWLRRIRERLDDDPRGAPDLATLAREAGVHRVHLSRSFRRFFGRSVGDHLRRLRLRRAQVEIARGEPALGRVALRAGFYDQSHFNRHFKKTTGMTPGRFRELIGRS